MNIHWKGGLLNDLWKECDERAFASSMYFVYEHIDTKRLFWKVKMFWGINHKKGVSSSSFIYHQKTSNKYCKRVFVLFEYNFQWEYKEPEKGVPYGL